VYYRRNGNPTGEHVTVRACLRPRTRRFAGLSASELGLARLNEVCEDMIGLGWARSAGKKAVSIVKRMFRWAAESELVPAYVVGAIRPDRGLLEGRSLAKETERGGPVADEVVDANLAHVSPQIAALVRILRLTGCRPGEALAMTAAQIDRTDPP
jgi:integrase